VRIEFLNDITWGPMGYGTRSLLLAGKAVFLSHDQEAIDLSEAREGNKADVDKRRNSHPSTWGLDHTFFWVSSPRIRS
jgi:hypothetical protein